jgi:hypothetical protein
VNLMQHLFPPGGFLKGGHKIARVAALLELLLSAIIFVGPGVVGELEPMPTTAIDWSRVAIWAITIVFFLVVAHASLWPHAHQQGELWFGAVAFPIALLAMFLIGNVQIVPGAHGLQLIVTLGEVIMSLLVTITYMVGKLDALRKAAILLNMYTTILFVLVDGLFGDTFAPLGSGGAGFVLLKLVYIAVFALLVGMSFTLLYRAHNITALVLVLGIMGILLLTLGKIHALESVPGLVNGFVKYATFVDVVTVIVIFATEAFNVVAYGGQRIVGAHHFDAQPFATSSMGAVSSTGSTTTTTTTVPTATSGGADDSPDI